MNQAKKAKRSFSPEQKVNILNQIETSIKRAIIVERAMALFVKRKINQKDLSKVIADDIRSGDLNKALRRAEKIGQNEPLGIVAAAGI